LNPAYTAAVKALLKSTPFFELIGMELLDLSSGSSVFTISPREKHLNPFQNVHGGVLASILDAAAFWAIYSKVDGHSGLVTVELKANYLMPCRAGQDLRAEGLAVKAGKKIGVAEVKIMEAGTDNLCVWGMATCMVTPPPIPQALETLPGKFIQNPIS
jgi:acyl-CoA thioesterase